MQKRMIDNRTAAQCIISIQHDYHYSLFNSDGTKIYSGVYRVIDSCQPLEVVLKNLEKTVFLIKSDEIELGQVAQVEIQHHMAISANIKIRRLCFFGWRELCFFSCNEYGRQLFKVNYSH